jgi:hypothetical protein
MKTLDKHRSIVEMNFIRKFPSFRTTLRIATTALVLIGNQNVQIKEKIYHTN